MDWLAGQRLALNPRPARRQEAALEVALLGHCPGRVRLERLLVLTEALRELREVGYNAAVDGLERISKWLDDAVRRGLPANCKAALLTLLTRLDDTARLGLTRPIGGIGPLTRELDASLRVAGHGEVVAAWRCLAESWTQIQGLGLASPLLGLLNNESGSLYHLPLPFRGSAEFLDVFPDAGRAPTAYSSVLAGREAWLAQAVEDFFVNGGEKLWVVRLPEWEGQAAFLPAGDPRLGSPESLRGLATVLAIPTVAVVALPDLERLQVPARLPDVPRVRLENPEPAFLPCGTRLDDGHRERRNTPEMNQPEEPWPLGKLLAGDIRTSQPGLLAWLERERPDVMCLLSLPLTHAKTLDSPALDPAALADLAGLRDGAEGHCFRHAQFLFPYLRGPAYLLRSPVGAVAGQQAAVARRYGPWRSMAARPLMIDALPFPPLSLAEVIQLRDRPGLGLLIQRSGRVSLDDERLLVPALPLEDVSGQDPARRDGYRAAEVMRFLGFLRRQLQRLGEQLVFDADYRDPRPRLLLERFLRQLHTLGALRGALPEDAFRIVQSEPREGALLFEIMIAPAFPIDRLFLTFTNLDGVWRTEVNRG